MDTLSFTPHPDFSPLALDDIELLRIFKPMRDNHWDSDMLEWLCNHLNLEKVLALYWGDATFRLNNRVRLRAIGSSKFNPSDGHIHALSRSFARAYCSRDDMIDFLLHAVADPNIQIAARGGAIIRQKKLIVNTDQKPKIEGGHKVLFHGGVGSINLQPRRLSIHPFDPCRYTLQTNEAAYLLTDTESKKVNRQVRQSFHNLLRHRRKTAANGRIAQALEENDLIPKSWRGVVLLFLNTEVAFGRNSNVSRYFGLSWEGDDWYQLPLLAEELLPQTLGTKESHNTHYRLVRYAA